MISRQRKIHFWVWLLITPLLLISINYFGQPAVDQSLVNVRALVLPDKGKGMLP